MSHAIYVNHGSHPVIVQPETHTWRPAKGATPWFIVDTITDRVVAQYKPHASKIKRHWFIT